MSFTRDAHRLWRELRQQGFSITTTGGSHVRIDHPDFFRPVYAPSTPSDYRSLRNVRAKIRRHLKGSPQ